MGAETNSFQTMYNTYGQYPKNVEKVSEKLTDFGQHLFQPLQYYAFTRYVFVITEGLEVIT